MLLQKMLFRFTIFALQFPQVLKLQTCATPPNYPSEIPLKQINFRNWAGDIVVNCILCAVPSTPDDIVTLVNWAYSAGWTVRAKGEMHSWLPLTVVNGTQSCPRILLIDLSVNMNNAVMASGLPTAVTVQAGATMDQLTLFLQNQGYGFFATPAPGDVTIGGALAIDGHGTGIVLQGQTIPQGKTGGTLSNLILSFTAVVWNGNNTKGAYGLQTFSRSDARTSALLVSFGRFIITEVTLQVGQDVNVRCQSFTNIPAAELFAPPTSNLSLRTFASYVQAGAVEVIWFPFTDSPWLKVWSIVDTKPISSVEVTSPYNYPFSDNIPPTVANLVNSIMTGAPSLAPALGGVKLQIIRAGLLATSSGDIWGASRNVFLYIKPTTLLVTANGFAILTNITSIQHVVYTLCNYYNTTLYANAAEGKYPINGPVEIRVTNLDKASDILVEGAGPPLLSAASPIGNFEVAIWFDILCIPGTPGSNDFYEKFETFLYQNFNDGINYKVRAEWSKGWAYTSKGPWTNEKIMKTVIPASFPPAADGTGGWRWAINTLDQLDPNHVFSNDFLQSFLSHNNCIMQSCSLNNSTDCQF